MKKKCVHVSSNNQTLHLVNGLFLEQINKILCAVIVVKAVPPLPSREFWSEVFLATKAVTKQSLQNKTKTLNITQGITSVNLKS